MTLKTKVTTEIEQAIANLETRCDDDTTTTPYTNELLLRVNFIQEITACETQTLMTVTRLYRTLDSIWEMTFPRQRTDENGPSYHGEKIYLYLGPRLKLTCLD